MPEIHSITAFYAGLPTTSRLFIALVVTLIFAVLGRFVHGVSLSGAFAGAVASFSLFAGAGPGAFVALVSVFALTWLVTRLGYRRKLTMGTAEKRDGRTASQVLANLATAALCATVYGWIIPNPAFLLAIVASLSEAAADTVSSELGQVFNQKARLITTWEEIPAGVDGGVTLIGTLLGLLAGTTITFACFLVGLVPKPWIVISVFAAFGGTVADSLLGALLERRRLLNNDAVNFLSTLIAAVIALLLA